MDGKQPISLHASCFLPPAPTHVSQTVTGDTCFPLSHFCCVRPDSRAGRWRGGGGSGACAGMAQAPLRPPPSRLSLCSRLPQLHPSPSPHVPGCARQRHVVSLCRTWLPASPSLCVPLPCKAAHTPAHRSRSSLWSFPPLPRSIRLTALGVSRVACGASVSSGGPLSP